MNALRSSSITSSSPSVPFDVACAFATDVNAGKSGLIDVCDAAAAAAAAAEDVRAEVGLGEEEATEDFTTGCLLKLLE